MYIEPRQLCKWNRLCVYTAVKVITYSVAGLCYISRLWIYKPSCSVRQTKSRQVFNLLTLCSLLKLRRIVWWKFRNDLARRHWNQEVVLEYCNLSVFVLYFWLWNVHLNCVSSFMREMVHLDCFTRGQKCLLLLVRQTLKFQNLTFCTASLCYLSVFDNVLPRQAERRLDCYLFGLVKYADLKKSVLRILLLYFFSSVVLCEI